jgi:predicted enzyme related to lactoylglutathione lyase
MNRVVHFEIHAEDLERAKKFYQGAFGWELQQMGSEHGNYIVVMTGPGPESIGKPLTRETIGINGGMMKANAPRPPKGVGPNAYVCIIGVSNIDEMMPKIEAAGGKPHTDKMDVPGVGQLRYYEDTEGNIFGIIQAAMHQPQ